MATTLQRWRLTDTKEYYTRCAKSTANPRIIAMIVGKRRWERKSIGVKDNSVDTWKLFSTYQHIKAIKVETFHLIPYYNTKHGKQMPSDKTTSGRLALIIMRSFPCPINSGRKVRMSWQGIIDSCKAHRKPSGVGSYGIRKCDDCERGLQIERGEDFKPPEKIKPWGVRNFKKMSKLR